MSAPSLPTRPYLYASCVMEMPPDVMPIPTRPGQFVVSFGWEARLHVTAEQWDAIDAAVRAGMNTTGQENVA